MTLNHTTATLIRKPLDWSYTDAISIAMDMLDHHEITVAELDETVNQIWQEMMSAGIEEAG